ncbi:MAG: orotidine-5'-phosphate decarboxylase [Clostridiales bacterium]|nr:orotidine-5'-phosphate decarboxylase [Clostridiales bacterium]
MIDLLINKIEEKQNPTVVGLDPRLDFIPEFIKVEEFERHEKTPKAVAEIFLRFNKAIMDETYDLIPAVKPQIAMYEQYGHEGIRAYIETIKYAKQKGLLVIGDIKRSDIASTAEAYSNGHIGEVNIGGESVKIYEEDAITISPYLGHDSIEPFIENCKRFNRGLFILLKTSNAGSGEIQDLEIKGGKVYERVADLISEWGKELVGERGYSSTGAVVGATYPEQLAELRRSIKNVFFLVPGYGAQGGSAKDLKGAFDKNGLGAIINSSRGIIAAYKNQKYINEFTENEFDKAARQAVLDMKADIQSVI